MRALVGRGGLTCCLSPPGYGCVRFQQIRRGEHVKKLGTSYPVQRHWPLLLGWLSLAAAISCTSGSNLQTGRSEKAIANSHNDVVRFLEQATFGPTQADITHLEQDLGGNFGAWIDEQLAMPASDYPTVCCDGSRSDTTCAAPLTACGPEDFYALSTTAPSDCPANTPCRRDNYGMWKLQQIFYRNALTAPDQLRQRLFFALNQILVTSAQDTAINYADYMTQYLRMLDENAFGNYRDILYRLSRNPTMGRYLDNITNTRTQPNENYAREIMQLFSIGLVVLNADGTTDGTPTYQQDTVVDLTRALTGWINAPILGRNNQTNQNLTNYRDDLVANASRHDTGSKVLFAGSPFQAVIPANQSVDGDLNSAIDILFNHSNVGPFIGKALIQMFVTSNPSPQYVARVTAAFNDNGQRVRGDMGVVIRAVLLDPEARNESPAPEFGKLREPVLAVTNLLRSIGYAVPDTSTDADPVSDLALTSPGGTATTYLAQSQDVFRAPTVFNFFSPFFGVPGRSDLVGPEFNIYSTTTALSRDNLFYQIIRAGVGSQPLYRNNFVRSDLSALLPLADDANALVEALNQQLLHGQMSDNLKSIVVNALSGVSGMQRVVEATFLVSTSPAYQVQR